MYDYGYNTESYGPIRIAMNDAGLYPWLIRRQVRECVTWAIANLLIPILINLILYIPVNIFSVMSGWFFLG